MSSDAAPISFDIAGVSLRGRLAIALGCLEETVRTLGLGGRAFDDLRERLWRAMAAPVGEWRSVKIPHGDAAEIEALFDTTPKPDRDTVVLPLLRVFEMVHEVRERILSEPVRGTCDGSADAVNTMLHAVRHLGVVAPDVRYFARSPFDEHAGWGRSVPPAFFRRGVPWSEFEPSLRRSLRAHSVHERREAAHALCHIGLVSEGLRRVLTEVAPTEPDAETRRLCEQALHDLFDHSLPGPRAPGADDRPDFVTDLRSYWDERFPAWAPELQAAGEIADFALLESLDSPDPNVRRNAALRARKLTSIPASVVTRLREILRTGSGTDARVAAALALAEAPLDDALMGDLIDALDAPAVDVRAAAAYALGRFGPRAAPAVRKLVRMMADVNDDLFSSMAAFHASEALEAIGTVGVNTIVLQIIGSTNQGYIDRCLRKVAQRPDMVERTIDELNFYLRDEPWLGPKVQRAISVLRRRSAGAQAAG